MGIKPVVFTKETLVRLTQGFKRLLDYLKKDLPEQVKDLIKEEKIKSVERREEYGRFFAFVINLFYLGFLWVAIIFLLFPGSFVLGVPLIALLFGR